MTFNDETDYDDLVKELCDMESEQDYSIFYDGCGVIHMGVVETSGVGEDAARDSFHDFFYNNLTWLEENGFLSCGEEVFTVVLDGLFEYRAVVYRGDDENFDINITAMT